MKLSPGMHLTLARLNSALMQGKNDELVECLSNVDLNELLSEDTIAKVRARGKNALCIFLCTLGVNNDINVESSQLWLDCYHSIATGSLRDGVVRLSKNNVLRMTVEALIRKTPLKGAQLKSAKGGASAWHHAFELAFDSKDWTSAVTMLEVLGQSRIETSRWLAISKCVSERHSLFVTEAGIALVDVDYLKIARIYDLCIQAARNANANDAANAIAFLKARSLEIGGEHAQAIALLRQLEKDRKSTAMKVHIARNLCKAGKLEESIAELDGAIERFSRQFERPEGEAPGVDEFGQARPPESNFNVGRASQALGDLAKIFNDNGLKMFLVSGTLLGYEREGKLLDHDKDIDVGVIGWEKQYEICLALQMSGLFTVTPQYLKGSQAVYFPVIHNGTGTWIDIFIYYPQDGKLVTGVDFFFGYRQTFGFTPFELKPVNFLGVDMYVPADTDLNLKENFGNWRVPDTSYLSHLESPSTMDKGSLPFMMTARITALVSMITRKPAKLAKVVEVLRGYPDAPCAMSPQLLDTLAAVTTRLEQLKDTPEPPAAEAASQELEYA